MMARQSILLIGGTGFIGRALATRLAAEGHEVHVLSRTGTKGHDLPPGITEHLGDQGDSVVVAHLLNKCRHVFHLAASTTPADTVWHPAREAEQNLLPTLRFVECAQDYPDNRYVFLSTGGALYGDAALADEQTPPNPTSYHGAAKLALEHFFGVLAQRRPGSLTILRPSNVYGPEQPLRPGFGVIRTLLERVRAGEKVTVFGDGSAVRDYLYIDDLIDACLLAMDKPTGTYNIGSSKGLSLREVLSMIEKVTGRLIEIDHQPQRASDVRSIVLDTRRAKEQLGWQARVQLLEGLLVGGRMTQDNASALAEPRPVVSVCIANYNGIDVIDDCIHSIVEQTGSIPFEILIHDDASTDGSVGHINACYPGATLIESPNNVGFCIANNRLAAAAQGDYLLLLNNDAMLFPDALSTLLTEAQRLNRPAILSLPQYDADSGELLDIGSRLDPFYNPVPNRDPTRNDAGMVMGACLWIDRTLWHELGGFPEWFGSIGEDLYLCCRARLAGNPVRALGTSGYHHRVGKSFGGGKVTSGRLSSTFRRRALSERNKTFAMAATCPSPLIQLLLPIHLSLLLLEGVLLTLIKQDGRYIRQIYLPVFTALFQHRKEMHATRVAVSETRRINGTKFYSVFSWVPYKLQVLFKHGLPHIT